MARSHPSGDDVTPPSRATSPAAVSPGAPRRAGGRRWRAPLWWSTRTGLGARAALVVLVAGLALTAWLVLRPPPGVIQLPPQPSPVALGTPDRSGQTSPDAGSGGEPIVVHVAGAVAQPGLVLLDDGARLADAITAAGGARDGADLDAVNLAALARDGEQIYVPQEGEAPRPLSGAGAPGAGPTGPVDLNRADAAELETLRGIGPVTAAKIIAWRQEHGPFSSASDLLAIAGIGPATLADIEALVTV